MTTMALLKNITKKYCDQKQMAIWW